ncbi:MAG: class IV adenylate cyclase [SAR202 cluster bacterium]|nr:class IV adenylate cyclase [SAR202 cluster bacterium]
MPFDRNREIKRRCADFRPVRRQLRALGAVRDHVALQIDTLYRLPGRDKNGPPRRLKLRRERGTRRLIYYEDTYDEGLRAVRYQIVEVRDEAITRLLEAALGISTTVRKRRERWHLGNTLFNLDRVEGVGPVFEAEVVLGPDEDPDEHVRRYLTLFGPYLGEALETSNEELVGRGRLGHGAVDLGRE